MERYKLYTKPISALNDNLINDQNFDYKTTTTTVETEQSTVSVTITPTTANGEKENDNKSDNISQNWTFYVIIITVIMAMIVVSIIGFTIFGANNTTNKKKLKVKKPDQKKTKPKSKSPTNEKSLSKTKSPIKDKSDITPIVLMKTKNINKEIDFTKDFRVSFEDIEDDDNECIARQPVPRVSTEPFLVSKNLSLKPEDKPIHTNLFTRVTRSSEVSRTKSPTNKI
jgi:hypothetical protein